MAEVVALYIDPRGPYPALLGDAYCWDEARDARRYDGTAPVVAHPPCGPWGRLRHLNRNQIAELAVLAVARVRANGGVLEHPANSRLWDACLLPRPGELPDQFGGYSVAVNQSDWGHCARKPTWLYLVRVPRAALTPPPIPRPSPDSLGIGRPRQGRHA